MGLMDLFRPKRKEGDHDAPPRIALENDAPARLLALEKIEDQELLARAVMHESERSVYQPAMERITDQRALLQLALGHRKPPACRLATEKLDEAALLQVAREHDKPSVRQFAIERVTDQTVLSEAAINERLPSVRQAAMERVTDQRVLARIAKNDATWKIRQIAVTRINDQGVLAEIARSDKKDLVRQSAVKKLEDQPTLAAIAASDAPESVRQSAVRNLEDQEIIAEVALQDADWEVRKAAVRRLMHQGLLAEIAQNDDDDDVRAAAVKQLDDQELLTALAKSANDVSVRTAAVERLDDQETLAGIARDDTNDHLREAARARVTDPALEAEFVEQKAELAAQEAATAAQERAQNPHPIPGLVYMEVPGPGRSAVCSDDNCPCPEVPIERGEGYMYVSEDLAELRRRCPSLAEIKAWREQLGANVMFGGGTLSPVLTCEQGARLRNLDMTVAGQDATWWWETGKVPCRATPTCGTDEEETVDEQASEGTELAGPDNGESPGDVIRQVSEEIRRALAGIRQHRRGGNDGSREPLRSTGLTVLEFPTGHERAFELHQALLDRLAVEHDDVMARYRILKVDIPGDSGICGLVFVLGASEDVRNFAETAHFLPSAESFVAERCDSDWQMISATSTLSDVPDSDCWLDLSGLESRLVEVLELVEGTMTNPKARA